jgi:diguanylate cyclase (GGDEF)-like protein
VLHDPERVPTLAAVTQEPSSMSSATRLRVVALTLGIAGVACASAVVMVSPPGVGPAVILLLLAIMRALDLYTSYKLQPKENDQTWQVGEAIFLVAVVTLLPVGTLVATVAGLILGLVLVGVRPAKTLSNAGLEVLATSAGLGAFALMGGAGGGEVGLRSLFAGVVAAVAYSAVGWLLTPIAVAFISATPYRQQLSWGRLVFVQWGCAVSLGLLAAASTRAIAWAPVFALAPVALVQLLLNEHFRAERDRNRLDGLFRAATDAHASVLTQEVEGALHRTASDLLKCEGATVESRPPSQSEIGARLVTSDGVPRWLVARLEAGGEPFDDEDGRLLDALAAIGSSALENALLVEEIRRQAINDSLTGLANQVLFEDRVSQAAAAAWRSRERFAVVVLDLDAFKRVNDSLGHSTGNELLRLVGSRLTEAVRDVDTVARLGSDHFTILLPGIGTPQTAGVMAVKLLEAIRRPVDLGGQLLYMTASAGIAFFPDDGTQSEHLLRNADSAMHRAKSLGKDSYQIYAAGMNEQAQLRLARESELHNALAEHELRVRYQPQIDLRTGRIVGVEALVRWDHPVLGLIGPHEFVPLAEESGLIVDLDEWVLRESCRQARAWSDDELPPIRVAVNMSGRHFHSSERVVETVASVLGESGLAPDRLELEVTERIAVGDSDDAIDVLEHLRSMGVSIAIDDFGTGYSMLGRLQRFPIDRLKIDRTFVREIESAHGEAPIVAAMIAMARSLRLEVVAEGVETLEQQTFLRHHACDQAQGFLFSHAVEPGQIAALLRTGSVGFNLTAVS